MTKETAIINVAISTVSLLGLWLLVFWLYREYSVDRFRQEMFELRDSLFDAARNGLVDFHHPAYGLLRSSMNGFIRFGHRLGVAQVLLARWVVANDAGPGASFHKMWEKATRDSSPEQKAELDKFLIRMNLIAVRQIFVRSPVILVTLVLPLVSLVLIRTSLAQLLAFLREPLDSIDSTAFSYGQ